VRTNVRGSTVVVLGASGLLGTAIVELCVAHKLRVVAIVRRKTDSMLKDDLIRYVELVDPLASEEQLVQAFLGSDVVLSALATRNPLLPTTLWSKGIGGAVLNAVTRAKVPRFVVCTSRGTCRESSVLGRTVYDPNNQLVYELIIKPFFLRRSYVDMSILEYSILPKSTINFVVVNPPRLVTQPAQGSLQFCIGHSFRGTNAMTRADLAAFMLHCAFTQDAAFMRKSVQLRGS
jgi:hypothetical protein